MPNANYDSILTTTIESRSKTIQDNVTNNNAAYFKMSQRGNITPFNGGHKIIEPLSYAENTNAGWYSGAEQFTTGLTEELTAPEFAFKQLVAPIIITGADEIKNSGPAGLIDLLESKVKVAESTLENKLDAGLYGDGTESDGKALTGLGAAVPITVTNTYGNINRALAANAFWRSRVTDTNLAPAAATIMALFNTEYYALTRGTDSPDLILADDVTMGVFEGVLQSQLRFSQSKLAEQGFTALKFKNSDVVLSTGLGGVGTAATTFFLNTRYLRLRPFSGRNMVPLGDQHRPFNQDVTAKSIVWAGNLTCSGAKFHSRLIQS
jgi:hypothetical protein